MSNSTTDSSTGVVRHERYNYNPSSVGAIIFIALFILTTLFHLWQISKKRTWYFIPFVIGGVFEVIGYIARAINAKEEPGKWTLNPYIVQALLLLLAPTLFAASIYMILGRIIQLTNGEHHAPIRRTWLTKIFVTGDVLSFLIQAGGGGILAGAKSSKSAQTGEYLITGGLILQVIYFSIFIMAAGLFHRRISNNPTNRSIQLTVDWNRYLFVLYAGSGFVLIRSVYRVIEYIQGQDGYLQSKEIYLFLFDGAMMFLACVIFNIWHPSSIINKETVNQQFGMTDMESQGSNGNIYSTSTQVTEETGKR